MKAVSPLLTVLVLMGSIVFVYWVLPGIMTAPAQPPLESAETWCKEAVRNSWKWQSANKWCSASPFLIFKDPCQSVGLAGVGATYCSFDPQNCLAECEQVVAKLGFPRCRSPVAKSDE